MVWIDYAIIAVIAFSSLVSLIRGFVREALSLVTWGCAFLCCQSLLHLPVSLVYGL